MNIRKAFAACLLALSLATPAIAAVDPTLVPINTATDLLNFKIKAYVDKLFAITLTTGQRAAIIRDAAKANNISVSTLAQATGYSLADVSWYLAQGDAKVDPRYGTLLATLKTTVTPLRVKNLKPGAPLLITGSWLSEVDKVTFNNRQLKVPKRGYSSIEATLDVSECGPLEVTLYSGQKLAAGYHGVDSLCGGFIYEKRALQIVDAPTAPLVRGKSTAVRARIASATWPAAAELRIIQGGVTTYIPMIPSSIREVTNFNGMLLGYYSAKVPGARMQPDLSLAIIGNRSWKNGVEYSTPLSYPRVGPSTDATIVVVPLITSDDVAAKVPTTDVLTQNIIRHLPYADNVTVVINPRAKIDLKMNTNDDWFRVLIDIITLKQSGRYPSWTLYYGLVPYRGTGIVGIAFVGSTVAAGVDLNFPDIDGTWAWVFNHEVGHALGLQHAPCGGAANPDVNFPYAGGALGPVKLMDITTIETQIGSPLMADVMGYCGGRWFSDYNYYKIQTSVEVRHSTDLAKLTETLPLRGHMISWSPSEIAVLGSNLAPLEGGQALMITVDGRRVNAIAYQHSAGGWHVWVEGAPGKVYSF